MRPPLTHADRAAARQYAAPLALACTVGPGRPEGRDRPRTWSVIDRRVVTQAGSAAFRLLPRTLRPPPEWRRPPRTIATLYRAAAEQPKPGFVGGASGGPACAAAAVQPPAPRPAGPPGAMRAGVPRPSAVCGAGRPLAGASFLRHCGPAARPGARAVGPWARAARCSGRPAPAARIRAPPSWAARARPLSAVPAPPGLAAVGGLPARLRFWGAGVPRSGPLLAFGWPPAWFPARPPLRGASALLWRAVARRECGQKVIGWTAPTGPG